MDEVFDRKRGVGKTHSLAGNWGKQVFKNNNPIILELGCGKGSIQLEWVSYLLKKILLE